MKQGLIILAFVIVLDILVSRKAASAVALEAIAPKISAFKTSPTVVARVNLFENYIHSASMNQNIPEKRIKAHIAVESGGLSDAVGSTNEVGLMQMKAGALEDFNNRFASDVRLTMDDLREPNYSIASGAGYLRILLDQTGGNLDVASMAYNQGAVGYKQHPQASADYLAKIKQYEKLF